jgi:hypothetical protein
MGFTFIPEDEIGIRYPTMLEIWGELDSEEEDEEHPE